jgi:hypothetical protein
VPVSTDSTLSTRAPGLLPSFDMATLDTKGFWQRPFEPPRDRTYQPVTLPTAESTAWEFDGLRKALDKSEAEDAYHFLNAERAARYQGPGGAVAYWMALLPAMITRALFLGRQSESALSCLGLPSA